MSMTWFSVDGLNWDMPCQIKRVANVQSSEISGMLLDKTYFNDVLGTWLVYDVAVAVPLDQRDRYTTLYNILTDPVSSHTFQLPYNNGMIEIQGRIEQVQDTFVRLPGDQHYWKGIQFTVVSDHPSKTYTLNEVLTVGRDPFPDAAGLEPGDYWLLTEDGWIKYEYEDADNMKF